ncbi:tyrosine-protein phosphatase [Lactobacillus sp. ESL0681]|uniref:tyrosine-protein phosphatase n=1 Tax=Lactobacillus sp. ESL0681 TaxID=2983211 RepID=UPI0023F76047|nr:tyrosine-protein phosphatase [Lactobacillus sp. ESL0681]WEV40015.1 tyrosine-protein phosphatase [Lactobacillus sp. ESL0681]
MTTPVVLPVKSIRNPRDLGGYCGLNGRKVKRHRLLRTGSISAMTSADEQVLLDYGLTKVIDLRSSAERRVSPDRKIAGVEYFALPLSDKANSGEKNQQDMAEYRVDQYAGFRLMCDRYRNHILTSQAKQSFRQILQLIADTDRGAILYHCSEGKDRTGLVTVLILEILGVDLETIRQDYLFSNYMLNDYRAKREKQFVRAGENDKFRANMRILGTVSDAFLDSALITINENYGSIKQYIEQELGISSSLQSKIRNLYLEK